MKEKYQPRIDKIQEFIDKAEETQGQYVATLLNNVEFYNVKQRKNLDTNFYMFHLHDEVLLDDLLTNIEKAKKEAEELNIADEYKIVVNAGVYGKTYVVIYVESDEQAHKRINEKISYIERYIDGIHQHELSEYKRLMKKYNHQQALANIERIHNGNNK